MFAAWKVKVTVMKTFSPEDVFGHELHLPSGQKINKCSLFNEGDEFIIDSVMQQPEGFCGWAWRDLYKDIAVLFFGGNFAMGPGIQYTSCTDGKKPVCFKLERLEETVTSGY
ncbi:MAG: TIGR04076 family protein [Candidatus Thorarchaeota archaeon]|nr:MAG: TIGR04076 family protein [Candidatus Thorarchaeota archaeon]